jgi:pre-rRNA-processing protein TSR1
LAKTEKGRITPKAATSRRSHEVRRLDKKNKMQQIRANKRHEVLMKKRKIGIEGSPPHLIVVIPLSKSIDAKSIGSSLCSVCDGGDVQEGCSRGSTRTVMIKHLKQRFTVVSPSTGDLYEVLHVAMVANTVVYVYDGMSGGMDSYGELCLLATRSQGLSSTCHVVTGLSHLSGKKHQDAKKTVSKLVEKNFPAEKLHSLDTPQDATNILRYISNQKQKGVKYRDTHPHLVVDKLEFEEGSNPGCGTLRISGYVRGRALSSNGLVYLSNYGAFQMSQIDGLPDPYRLKPLHTHSKDSDMVIVASTEGSSMEEGVRVLETADPTLQESLISEVTPDPMEGEQTWPTEEELKEAEELARQVESRKKKVPKGTSSYQAAWIVDSDEDEGDEDDVDESDVTDEVDSEAASDEGETMEQDDMGLVETTTETGTVADDERYDEDFDIESEKKQLEMLKAAREDEMFPDEVDTPMNVSARVRFAKFRGLQSFRHSPWDPKENLPLDYARIFQFENFSRTKKKVLNTEDDQGALPGWYVSVHIAQVPSKCYVELLQKGAPLVVFGLLPHENKMSVAHFVLKMTKYCTHPLKSKDRLIFNIGARRFSACPIFSQHTAGDKHKYERFFRPQTVVVASVYCPIVYPPTPVLVFNDDISKDGQICHTLIATGTVHRVDPDRVVCKKVVLSGHPFKIHRRSAVIRYMFFDREDILWFKPVELRTKYGRRGNIKEPLGMLPV